jgi:hypothetical protein
MNYALRGCIPYFYPSFKFLNYVSLMKLPLRSENALKCHNNNMPEFLTSLHYSRALNVLIVTLQYKYYKHI